MTPERWQRIKTVFGEAIAIPAENRDRFVAESCAADEELRVEVTSLLAAHAREVAVVDRPAAEYVTGSGIRAGADRWIGQRLGAYELTALIGRGGMGEVYRARRVDDEYDKEVAIKIVPSGYLAEPVLQRLRTERQILATLEHPNIARLIDGGASTDGVPYLVMELVDGVPIDDYCKALPIDRVLALFRQACGAVSYAHQRLVVHRDLKPSNILVTRDNAVKLLDFGIAKLLRPEANETAAMPALTLLQTFTPAFASPEQVLGHPVTTASDVYSLGVVLYLLLSGRGPYRGRLESTQDAIREICETEPDAPSVAAGAQAVRRIAPDLDAICLRALRKEPDKRYRSVEELSEDVRRHLVGLPVIARGDRLSYRAGKFLRRHRLEASAAALIALALVAGALASWREARIAEAERARAERHFASVRRLADTFIFKVHDAIAPLPGATEARSILVTTGLEYLNTLAQEAGDDPALKLDLARAFAKLAAVQGKAWDVHTGDERGAIASYRKAGALLEEIVAADPANVQAREALASALLQEGRVTLLVDGPAAAKPLSTRAVAMYEKLAAGTQDTRTWRALAGARRAHAVILDYLDQQTAAFEQTGIAIEVLERLVAHAPDDLQLARELAGAYGTSAVVLMGVQRDEAVLDRVLAMHRKALAIEEKLIAGGANTNDSDLSRSVAASHTNIAGIHYMKGDYRNAIGHARAALELMRGPASDEKNMQLNVDMPLIALPLALALRGLGQFDEVERVADEHLAMLARAGGENLQAQFLIGAYRTLLGGVHEHRAAAAGSRRAERRAELALAHDAYEDAMPRFEKVMAAAALDFADRAIVEEARSGLARTGRTLATSEVSSRAPTTP
jgi:tRNA A-37 threonylcarbamoyl transferase component Bud32/tetratricopeptide (TPR) repeat protein